ncbi:MAG TPA: DUF5668 domain-containing protein [Candidatus Dormibacteraeota bacterium]|nr:DUF5668 domain-containing protein [Candidatus Dormibacteraeota bacterium]
MRQYRGFFWPAVLILIGVLALLANSGLISADRLSLLSDMWPLILIVIGLELFARRALQGPAADVAAVLIVVLAAGGAIVYVALGPNPGVTKSLDSKGAVGNLNHASLELDVGAATVTVDGSTSLEGDLYRAHIVYSGPEPGVSLDRSTGNLQISQGNSGFGTFQTRRFTLNLQINPSVPWKLVSSSGASTDSYKLAAVHVSSMEINTGASREDITLGPPTGTVPITIDGGALTVHLHRPSGAGASVTVSGGAVSLDFDGHQNRGIGSVQEASGSGSDMYRVEISGGACTVTMDATTASS